MLGAKTGRFGFGATALLCAGLCSGGLSAQTSQYRVEGPRSYYEYYISPGDILQISFDRHPELSKAVVVRPSGVINLPRFNTVKVAGLSVQAASDLLRQKLQSMGDQSCVTIAVKRRTGHGFFKKSLSLSMYPRQDFMRQKCVTPD
jgi:hypothetical protein